MEYQEYYDSMKNKLKPCWDPSVNAYTGSVELTFEEWKMSGDIAASENYESTYDRCHEIEAISNLRHYPKNEDLYLINPDIIICILNYLKKEDLV